MKRRSLTVMVLAGALVVAAQTAALADPFFLYGGYVDLRIWISLFAIGVVELVIVVVEGLAYCYFGRLVGWRAALTSLAANFASFVVGWHAEMCHLRAHYVRDQAIPWWVHPLTFVVAIAVEVPIVLLINLRFRGRRDLVRVAIVVNLITCLLLLNALTGFARRWLPEI